MEAPKNNEIDKKDRMTLLPMDLLRKYLIPAYEEGNKKYWEESWRLGFKISVLMDAALRHIEEFYWKGENMDPAASKHGVEKHHLAAAMFCMLSALNTLDVRPDLDDRIVNRDISSRPEPTPK